MSAGEAPATDASTGRLLVLGYALSGGVLWWAAHLVVASILVPTVCDRGGEWTIHLTTAVTALGAITALWASVAMRRGQTPVEVENQRTQFLSLVAILFNAASLALILLEGIAPVLVLSECAR